MFRSNESCPLLPVLFAPFLSFSVTFSAGRCSIGFSDGHLRHLEKTGCKRLFRSLYRVGTGLRFT